MAVSPVVSPAATGADTAFTATGWVKEVPVMPILCTNASSQVLLRGNAHIVDVESSDSRLTGKRLVFANASYLPDGTARVWGTAYQQVGTFDVNTNFTATAGLWEIQYTGVMDMDFSLTLSLAGYGSGGTIDGQRLQETMTRGPASGPVDLSLPYLYAGTIKAAPVNTVEMVDNFDDNLFNGHTWGAGYAVETNKQLSVLGVFTTRTRSIYDSYLFAGKTRTWSVPDRRTVEWRTDLVHLDENGTNTAILAVGTAEGPGYAFHLNREFAFVAKWSQPELSVLSCQAKKLPTSNVVMSLALTRMGQNVAIAARVLDKANPNIVLFENSPLLDTPNSDTTLNGNEFNALTGITLLDLQPDPPKTPPAAFYALVGVFKFTDGSQPFPLNTFDNLQSFSYEVPRVSLFPAVQIAWPAPVGVYGVQWGPTPEGPWQPLPDQSLPGWQQTTVPVSAPAEFIRLIQAP